MMEFGGEPASLASLIAFQIVPFGTKRAVACPNGHSPVHPSLLQQSMDRA